MNPHTASVVYVAVILALFWFDRERKVRTSRALWIPTLWLLINGSRTVSAWLEPGRTVVEEASQEGSPLDAAVFGILLLAALCVLAWRRARTVRFLRANAPILLYFAYCAISVLWADDSFVAFKRWTKAIGDLAVVLVVLTDPSPTAALRQVLSRIAFILLPLSVLFDKYYPDIGRHYNVWTWLPSYGGVTVFKNLLGITCLVGSLGSVWSLTTAYRERKGRDRIFHMLPHAVILAVGIYLFLTADSMTSFSCFVFGGILIALTTLKWVQRKPGAIHLLVVALIALPLAALFLPGTDMVQSLGRDASLTGRPRIWKAVIAVADRPMTGAGFESFWAGDRLSTIWRMIDERGIIEAHNGYLEVYLNLGWIGVTLLAVVIVNGYRNVITLFRRDQQAGSIRLAFFVVGIVFSFTEAGFRMMSLVWIAFLLSATAVPLAQRRKERLVMGGESRKPAWDAAGAADKDALETV